MTIGGLTWLSIPNDYNRWGSNFDKSLAIACTTLTIATNAVTTMMIAYKLWYVAVGGVHWIRWLTMR